MAVPVTQVESVSPELVLIDPRLAIDARARLSEVEELPTRRRSYRVPKLTAAIATWSTAAILIVDVQLYDWTTWLV